MSASRAVAAGPILTVAQRCPIQGAALISVKSLRAGPSNMRGVALIGAYVPSPYPDRAGRFPHTKEGFE